LVFMRGRVVCGVKPLNSTQGRTWQALGAMSG
jgi:hypothetical protein